MSPRRLSALLASSLLAACSVLAHDGHDIARPDVAVRIDLGAPGVAVQPTLHGLFFEDINYAADGGLYAELVQNRSFEHQDKRQAWSEVSRSGAEGKLTIEATGGLNANNPSFLRLAVSKSGGGFGVSNTGFGGIALKAGATYRFSTHVRARGGANRVLVRLETVDGRALASAALLIQGSEWNRQELTLKSEVTEPNARLVLLVDQSGEVDLDVISLFPTDTFKGRPNGLRADLAQALADLRPGFIRFPGGCIVEGNGLANAYRWKDTVGEIWERRQNWNLWSDPKIKDYQQTYGLGFFEFFQFARDIGAEPLPVLNCGMACQFRGGGTCPPEELQEFIQDALDLIEFANGPATSKWGSLRARMGHPESFELKFLAVGNEQWGDEYFRRYNAFEKVLRERHPEIKIISSSGPAASGRDFDAAWNQFKSGVRADLVDEHYYVPPGWLLANIDRYDSYDRNGPKVFVGEFAAHDTARRSTLRAALTEAAYMTGLLHNADVVHMASYAPLLAKFGHTQWEPNLVWFDNSRVLLTASYHAQALYGRNRVTRSFPIAIENLGPPPAAPAVSGCIGLGTWLTGAEYKDVEVIAADGRVLLDTKESATLDTWKRLRGAWSLKDGVLRQSEETPDRLALAGDVNWTDYTLKVKARKVSGAEGFMIHFGVGADGTGGAHINLGGWGNTSHGLELPGLPTKHKRGSIESDRWYDVRIEVRGSEVKTFLDGEPLLSGSLAEVRRDPVYAAFGRDDETGEYVVHATHPSAGALRVRFSTGKAGLGNGNRRATATVLSGVPSAVNSLEKPDAVAPRTMVVGLHLHEGDFDYVLPPYSHVVLRIAK